MGHRLRASMTLTAHHFGPHPAFVGGMATVLQLYEEHSIGADKVVLHATWIPGAPRASARLTARALRDLSRISADAVVHVHVSEGGSFLREGSIVVWAHRRRLQTAVTLHGANFVPFAA